MRINFFYFFKILKRDFLTVLAEVQSRTVYLVPHFKRGPLQIENANKRKCYNGFKVGCSLLYS